jgi:hypothetical protein
MSAFGIDRSDTDVGMPTESSAAGAGVPLDAADTALTADDEDKDPTTEAMGADEAPDSDGTSPGIDGCAVAGAASRLPTGSIAPVEPDAHGRHAWLVDPILAEVRPRLVTARWEVTLRVATPGGGEVRMQLVKQGGTLSVVLAATDAATRDALQAHLPELRRSLTEAGVVLSTIRVALVAPLGRRVSRMVEDDLEETPTPGETPGRRPRRRTSRVDDLA